MELVPPIVPTLLKLTPLLLNRLGSPECRRARGLMFISVTL
jgi:hypothetical protein